MKKKILVLIALLMLTCGCSLKDDFSDKYIYTTFIVNVTTRCHREKEARNLFLIEKHKMRLKIIFPNDVKPDFSLERLMRFGQVQ